MVKHSRSLQKADAYMEPEPTSTMVPDILNGLLFSQYKLRHRSSKTFIDLKRDLQSEAKLEQIIAIVTTFSVTCCKLSYSH